MKTSRTRLLSLLLALVMVFSMLPVSALAADGKSTDDTDIGDSELLATDQAQEGEEGAEPDSTENEPQEEPQEKAVAPIAESNVAKVGNTEYATIDEAIAAWTNGNGTTLTLLADVTLSDVITLKSTEHHILNLGTYTMTAASGKNAIEIVAHGTGASERTAITIQADAANPGGINAGSKSIIYYDYSKGTATGDDRPIIKIEGGVFTGSISSFGTAGIYTKGSAARKCATLNISGGTFNCTINGSGKSKLIISGGTFNYSVGSQGDSTANRLISGGKFKTLGFMTADSNNTKFWFGTSMANSNVGLYVDKAGYLVVGGPVITEVSEKYVAVASNATKWSSYLAYSAAATYGLFYEDADMAIAKHGAANVTIWEKPAVTIPETMTGTVVDEIKNNTALKGYTPENLPTGAELEIELVSVGETIVYDVAPMADGAKVDTTEAITFRLPVPASVTKIAAKVYHEGELLGTYTIQGEGNAKYVEISSADFSEYAVEPIDAFTVAHGTLEMGPANTLAEALDCNDTLAFLLSWNDPSVLPVVTLNGDYTITENFLANGEYPFILDLNGKTLTVAEGATLSVGSDIRITGEGSVVGDIKLTESEGASLNVADTITVDDMTVVDAEGKEMVKGDDGEYGPAPVYVAEVNGVGCATLQEAFAAAQNGDTIVLLADIEIVGETFTIADGKSLTLDMNGKKITATDNKAVNVSYELFYIYGEMTVTGNGTIVLTSTSNDTAWAKSSTIFHNRGGVFTVENGTYKHLGGTAMAFVVDNSANSYGDATTTIKGGTLTSSYIAIRNRMERGHQNGNPGNGKAILNIKGGTISGTSRAIWAQASSADATYFATGAINVSGGEIGLIDTARSSGAVSMTTISGGSVAAFKGEVGELTVTDGTVSEVTMLTAAGAAADFVITDSGLYAAAVAKIGETKYADLQAAINAAQAGDTVTVLADVNLSKTLTINKSITLNLNGHTISGTHGTEYSMIHVLNGAELTVEGNGKISYAAGGNNIGAAVWVEGALVLESGTIEVTGTWSLGFAVDLRPNAWGSAHTTGASFTMYGGKVASSDTAVRVASNSSDSYTELGVAFTMYGGSIESTWDAIFVQHLYAGNLDVKVIGGTVSGENSVIRIYGDAGSDVDIAVTGGKFTGVIKVADAYKNTDAIALSGGTYSVDVNEYCADGYKARKNADGTYGVQVDPAYGKVAKIGETYYATFEAAYAAANAGETIVLLADLNLSEILVIDKAITLDGNGKTLTSTAGRAINVSGANGVTIQNLTINCSGERAINVIQNATHVTLDNVIATSANYTVNVASSAPNAVVAIKNSKLNGLCTVNVAAAGAKIAIDNSTINCNDNNTTAGEAYAALSLNREAVGGSIVATNSIINVAEGSDSYKGRNGAENGTVTINGSTEDVLVIVAVITYEGSNYYYSFASIAKAIEFAKEGDTITLIRDISTIETYTVPTGKKVTLDLNGKTITGTDNATGSFGLITNKGDLTITGNGKITLTAKNDRDWNAYSSVISNTVGGKLTVESGVIEHLGGTDMAYAIDNLTNGKGTYAETVINGGTVKSTYRAIRMFLNGVEAQNILTINGGVIEGGNKSVWMQDPSKNANTGKLTIGANATLNGDVYLSVTAGSTEWPVEVSIAASAVNGEVLTANLPQGYSLENKNGTYGVAYGLVGTGTAKDPYQITNAKDLVLLRDTVNSGKDFYEGKYFKQTADIDLAGINWVGIGSATAEHGFMGNFDGNGFKIKNLTITDPTLDSDGYAYAGLFAVTEGIDKDHQNVIKNLTIGNVTISTSGHIVSAAIAYPYYTKVENVTVCGNIAIAGGDYTAGVLAYTRRCVNARNLTIDGEDGSYITGRNTVGGVISDIQMNGGLTANYRNFSASNLTITGVKSVGGISGIIGGQTLYGATVMNVNIVCSDARKGIVAGSLGDTATIEKVTTDDTTNAIIGAYYGTGKPVAVVSGNGKVYYSNLQAAVEAGGQIKLIANVEEKAITINDDVSINFNGMTYTVTGDNDIEIMGGTVTFRNGGTIKGADMVQTGGTLTMSTNMILEGKLTVEAGHLTMNAESYVYELVKGANATTKIVGYTGVMVEENAVVATVGNREYATLQAAFDDKDNTSSSQAIVLQKDVTLTETLVIPAATKAIVLDLNGFTISQEKACTGHYAMIENNSKSLTIKDTVGGGKISFKDTGAGDPNFGWGSYTIANNGQIILMSGTIANETAMNNGSVKHMYCAIQQNNTAAHTQIRGGAVTSVDYRSIRINAGKLTVNAGEIVGQIWIQPFSLGIVVTINGGSFQPMGVDGSSIYVDNSAKTVIFRVNGGTFATKIGCANAAGLKNAIRGGKFTQDAFEKTAAVLFYKVATMNGGAIEIEG